MSEDHLHHHSGDNLKVAFFLNLGFTVLEIFGGIWTNSIAILSDAVHDLGDSLSLGLAWYFERLSKRGPPPQQTYGYRRYRLLGGLITGVVLLAGLGFVLWHSFQRLFVPAEVRMSGIIGLAILGVLFNGVAVLKVRKGNSLTENLVSWHLLEDTLGWGAVLIGAGVMAIWDVPIVDPILSIGISLVILWNVGRNLKKVLAVLLQATPIGFDLEAFVEEVEQMEGVVSLHDVHCWSIDGESRVLSAHIVGDGRGDWSIEIRKRIRDLLDDDTLENVTLEVESPDFACPQDHG
ncbi:MAG: cation transporter [Verrucomicrobiae bacterium]|nr:cation transporter [Verrucomicrobiae bacterium]